MTSYNDKGAVLSKDGRYRYRLWRQWAQHDAVGNACVFVMLNPSTADGHMDDPTIRRCVSFAKREGFHRLEVVNLFAHRATSPMELLALRDHMDPVGPDNLAHVAQAVANGGKIICAWGAHGGHLNQDETALGWIMDHKRRRALVQCLGTTKAGFPRHPLYVPGDTPLEHFGV